jgi:hypothetical protein
MTTETDNTTRWTPDRRGHYEVYYLTWNHPGTDQGFWLRYTLEAPLDGDPRAELWFARFDPRDPSRTFGVHRSFAASQFASATDPFTLTIAGATLAHDGARGEFTGAGHTMRWDLRWQPAQTSLRLLPELAYSRKIGDSSVVSPNPKVWMTGSVTIDGDELRFDNAPLGQSHIVGTKHAYEWAWGRCADFAGAPDALLEIFGTRLRRGGLTLPRMMLVALDLDGERHRLNQFRHVVRNHGRWTPGHVTFSAWSPSVKLEGEMTCDARDLIVTPYVDPDGTEVFCMNTEIGDARVIVSKRSGLRWREHRRLDARHRAHFEVAGRTADPRVATRHIGIH